jgi:hypothetical protein
LIQLREAWLSPSFADLFTPLPSTAYAGCRFLFLLLPLGEEGAEALGHRVVGKATLDVLQQQVAQVFDLGPFV